MPDTTPNPSTPTPEPFACPYSKQCMTREILRWLLPAVLAWLMMHTAGCTGSFGFRLSPTGTTVTLKWYEPDAPAPTTRPTTQPAP